MPPEYAGGNLWDPHLYKVEINANVDLHHPLGAAPDNVHELLILAMSFEEMRIFSDREKETQSNFAIDLRKSARIFPRLELLCGMTDNFESGHT